MRPSGNGLSDGNRTEPFAVSYTPDTWNDRLRPQSHLRRQPKRHSMISALKEMIDEASRMAKSKHAPAGERIRWTRLVGQLIWYKDAILRSMSLESMENEMFVIKKQVFEKKPEQKPPPCYMYPTFAEP